MSKADRTVAHEDQNQLVLARCVMAARMIEEIDRMLSIDLCVSA